MAAETETERERWMDFWDKVSPLKLLPTEAQGHVWAARKELLLAVRSLVDEAIRRVEEAEKPRPKKRTKIEVE